MQPMPLECGSIRREMKSGENIRRQAAEIYNSHIRGVIGAQNRGGGKSGGNALSSRRHRCTLFGLNNIGGVIEEIMV